MYYYSVTEWLAFFYIYCFFGWCFESTYVSLKSRKFVNRGFMHGPMLPLYGSGAILILFVTLPFRQTPILVYISGLIAATILEYIVGCAMYRIFKVRYWDYSRFRFQIQGQICLTSSIAWGFLSMAMVYVIHDPVADVVSKCPERQLSILTIIVTVTAAADFMSALKTALDIRELIIQAEKLKEELVNIRRRIEIIDTFAKSELGERAGELIDKIEDTQGVEAAKRGYRYMQESLQELTGRAEKLRVQFLDNLEYKGLGTYVEELGGIRSKLAVWNDRVRNQFSKDKIAMLRRNPQATYPGLPHFLEELREGRVVLPIKPNYEDKQASDKEDK